MISEYVRDMLGVSTADLDMEEALQAMRDRSSLPIRNYQLDKVDFYRAEALSEQLPLVALVPKLHQREMAKGGTTDRLQHQGFERSVHTVDRVNSRRSYS